MTACEQYANDMKTVKDILIEKRILVYWNGRLDFNLSRDGHLKSMNLIAECMHEYAQQFSEAHIEKSEEFTRENIRNPDL